MYDFGKPGTVTANEFHHFLEPLQEIQYPEHQGWQKGRDLRLDLSYRQISFPASITEMTIAIKALIIKPKPPVFQYLS